VSKNLVDTHGTQVYGVGMDGASRCVHYHSKKDIVAIQFYCCQQWYACIDCHKEVASHNVLVWPIGSQDSQALMCGECGAKFSIQDYLSEGDSCRSCGADFNPGCRLHHHLYFEVGE